MVFDIKNKVALVTGGARGIGLQYTKELLRNGVKGVTIADWDVNFGKTALDEINAEFGPNKAIFVKTDVTNKVQFEEAFKKTVETFKNVDILINNAGILDDELWEKEVAVNINGTINGITLAHENYLPKHKSGEEGLIVNISSVAGVGKTASCPIYCGTKFAVSGMTMSFGDEVHFQRTKVRVIGICPGATQTRILTEEKDNLGPAYVDLLKQALEMATIQSPEQCAKEVIKVLKKAPSGTIWVVEDWNAGYEYVFPDRCIFNTNK